MSHKYKDYSKPETLKEEPIVEEPVQEEAIEEQVVEEPKPTLGYVVDCKKLRVRKLPNPNAQVLCELMVGANLVIDLEQSTIAFYKVYTETGLEGYCMKQYIAIA